MQAEHAAKDGPRIVKIENLISDKVARLSPESSLSEVEEISIENCNYCAAVRTRSADRSVQFQRLSEAIARKLAQPLVSRERRLLEVYRRSTEVTRQIDVVLEYLINDTIVDATQLDQAVNALSKRKNRWERYLTTLARVRAGTGHDHSRAVMENICISSNQRNFCQLPLLTLFRIAKATGLPIPDWANPALKPSLSTTRIA